MIKLAKKKLILSLRFIRLKFLAFVNRIQTSSELVRFLWAMKMWWLIPVVVFLLMLGFLFIFAQGAAVTPFIYTLL